MKRTLSILICICMLVPVFIMPGRAESKEEIPLGITSIKLPAVEGTEELLKNGDLEDLDAAGRPEKWGCSAFGRTDGSGAFIISDEKAYEGNSLKLVGGASPAANPYISQTFETNPGAVYQLRTMIRKDSGRSGMTVKLEFYPEALPGLSMAWQVYTFNVTTTSGKWQEMLYNFKAPTNAKSVSVYFRLLNEDGEVCYYDNASICMVQPAEELSISPDQYFYYPEAEKGTASVKALTEYYPEAIGGSVVFSLMAEDKVLEQRESILDQNGEATFEYDTTLLTELKKEYILRAVLKDKDGKALYTKEDTIYKYARPKYIREDGVFQAPKEAPFHAVAAYHPYDEKDYAELKNAGITVLQGNEGMLSRAAEKGMKVLMVLYEPSKSAVHPDLRAKTIELVTKYKDDPRVFGWAVADEPYFSLPDPLPELKEAYKLIRDIDDNHPVYIVECTSKFLKDTKKVCDYVANDPYLPATEGMKGVKMNTSHVYDTTRITMAAAEEIKPTLELLHAFKHIDYLPDADAERHMIYQAYMAGATSHGYYAWDDAMKVDGISIRLPDVTETNIYEGIRAFAEKEQEDVFRHFVTKEYPGFSHYVGADVMYHSYIKDGKLYLIVMNQSTAEEKEITVPLTSFDGSISLKGYKAAYVSGKEGENFTGTTSSVTVTVPKHGVALLEITPAETVDFSILSKEKFWNYFKAVNEMKCSGEDEENFVENSGMEIFAGGKPDGYAVSKSGTASFSKETDPAKTHGGSAGALVLSGSRSTDTVTISKPVTLPAGKLDITAFMNLTGLTTGSGVKLELVSANGSTVLASTDWFVKTAYGDGTPMGWRKMMLCYTNAAEANFIVRVTFSGVGEVAIDDFAAYVTTDYVRNGDLEGFAGDYKPAGAWYYKGNSFNWGEEEIASVMMEPDGNHYLSIHAKKFQDTPREIYYNLSINNAPELRGRRGVLQFDYVGNRYSTYAYIGASAPPIVWAPGKTIGSTGSVWRRDYSMYYTNPLDASNNSFFFGCASGDDIVKIDNISFGIAEDKLTVSETDDEVKADLVAFGTDYSAENKYRTLTVILARYRVYGENNFYLDEIETGTDTAEMVAIINSLEEKKDNPTEVGETPLRASAALAKPADGGEYVYKAFVWDDISSICPQTKAISFP
ncbi:MAG: hypothetical protein E7408_01795 [Ruminococcaceae bacterium]|nr:hypothetical protein [Oscillospiraceae bacterium]